MCDIPLTAWIGVQLSMVDPDHIYVNDIEIT
jgi:hypothetical protein